MVKVTVKSLAALEELFSIKSKEAMTFELKDEEATKLFKLAMKKRFLDEVEFRDVGEMNCSSEKMKKTKQAPQTGVTQEIKRIFDENPKERMTCCFIKIKLRCRGIEPKSLSSILNRLVKSGYLTSTDKTYGEFKTYKKKIAE